MELHFRTTGAGSPVILLHGLFGSGDNLGALARALAERHRVHALDLRNHGRSPHAPGMDYASMAEDVLDTLDRLDIDRAAVIGHSMGGKTAMELAVSVPERVKCMISLDIAPVHYEANHNRELEAMLALDPVSITSRRDADTALSQSIPSAAIRQFLLKNLARKEGHLAWRIPLEVIADQYPALAAAPAEGRFDGPALFIAGEQSDYVKPEHESAVRARFPDASIERIAEAGHWVHTDAPRAVARRIREFLSEFE